MDSLTQLTLGSAVGIAVMGRRTAVWKAALWGGLCGTLPDLDAFIDHGDPVRNMTFHRAESHALAWLTLASPLIASGIARLHREAPFRRWWLAVWLALVTHPLLDLMTVYGTQLALPFTDHPFAVGSVFIIDPLYTLPLVVGVVAALVARSERGLRWNAACLGLGVAYLGWSFVAQEHVAQLARASLAGAGIEPRRVLVTPTPFNTLLWRVVAVTPDAYYEGYRSLLDDDRPIDFARFDRHAVLYEALRGDWSVARIAWFSHGFFKMSERDGFVTIADLRMGIEPYYTFTFVVARRDGARLVPVTPQRAGSSGDAGPALEGIWHRLKGNRS
jgi:inner membrane protein